MITQKGNIRAMNCPTHIQTAGHGNPYLGRKRHALEIIKKLIHDRFDHGGGVRCRRMTVDIALCVDNIGYPGTGSADRELETAGDMFPAHEVLLQGLHLALTVHHEFDIIAGGETHMSVTMLISDITDLPDMLNGHKPASTASNRKDLVAAFSYVYKNARLQDVVILPLPIIFLNNGREILPEVPWTKVRDSVFHGFIGVKQSKSFSR
jgi:hypothetical protein